MSDIVVGHSDSPILKWDPLSVWLSFSLIHFFVDLLRRDPVHELKGLGGQLWLLIWVGVFGEMDL